MELKQTGKFVSYTPIVLIVPYGIETTEEYGNGTVEMSVNCTLWNWNIYEFIEGI